MKTEQEYKREARQRIIDDEIILSKTDFINQMWIEYENGAHDKQESCDKCGGF